MALLRRPLRVSLTVAAALSQVGEFSFILATMGLALGLIPDAAFQLVVAASIVSITVNPRAVPARAGPPRPGSARGPGCCAPSRARARPRAGAGGGVGRIEASGVVAAPLSSAEPEAA